MRLLPTKATLCIGVLATIGSLWSQTPPAQKLSFEVTSVKPNKSGSDGSRLGIRPNGYFFATNASLKSLIVQAYRILDFQVSGGPSWIEGDRFDVEARAEPGSISAATGPPDPNRPDTMSLMIQSLLEDRFQLKLHKETREEVPVFALVIDKGGAKLEASVEGRPGPDGMRPGSMRTRPLTGQPGLEILGSGVNIAVLAGMIAVQVGRPVIDKTNLSGMFDFSLKVLPQPRVPALPEPGGGQPLASDPVLQANPAIARALQEQLGLRLDSTRGAVEFLIIDSVQKPSEN